MYYPYLRGKQFELILLRDNVELLKRNNFHPIIEPVKHDFKALKRTMEVLNEKDVHCTLIVNPKVGESPVSTKSILNELINDSFKNYKNISLGYIVDAESNIDELIYLLDNYKSFSFTIVHYGYSDGKKLSNKINQYRNIKNHVFIDGMAGKLYQRHFKDAGSKRILIRNGFKPQKKNSLYPHSEHFSDLHITYTDENMNGFGDFLIVGDDYSETGGPAYAVAIHLTYLNDEGDMFIYHFISDQTSSPTDPGGKFLEALKKLVSEINKPKSLIYRSSACKKYLELYDKQHYPGLGSVKKLSMQHHLELIANFINQSN